MASPKAHLTPLVFRTCKREVHGSHNIVVMLYLPATAAHQDTDWPYRTCYGVRGPSLNGHRTDPVEWARCGVLKRRRSHQASMSLRRNQRRAEPWPFSSFFAGAIFRLRWQQHATEDVRLKAWWQDPYRGRMAMVLFRKIRRALETCSPHVEASP